MIILLPQRRINRGVIHHVSFYILDEIVSNEVFLDATKHAIRSPHISTRPYYYFGNYQSAVIYQRIKGQRRLYYCGKYTGEQ